MLNEFDPVDDIVSKKDDNSSGIFINDDEGIKDLDIIKMVAYLPF